MQLEVSGIVFFKDREGSLKNEVIYYLCDCGGDDEDDELYYKDREIKETWKNYPINHKELQVSHGVLEIRTLYDYGGVDVEVLTEEDMDTKPQYKYKILDTYEDLKKHNGCTVVFDIEYSSSSYSYANEKDVKGKVYVDSRDNIWILYYDPYDSYIPSESEEIIHAIKSQGFSTGVCVSDTEWGYNSRGEYVIKSYSLDDQYKNIRLTEEE